MFHPDIKKHQSWFCKNVQPIYDRRHIYCEFEPELEKQIMNIVSNDNYKPSLFQQLHTRWFSSFVQHKTKVQPVMYKSCDIETGFNLDEQNYNWKHDEVSHILTIIQ
mgnify:CR=1 FL=1